jgi:carbonic anhydrase/acetyltransferase-like protein (isoleucine patch superfamily)
MRVRSFAGKRPALGKRVFVASSAVLVGDVELGDDVSVWYGVVMRADISHIRIGARTNIQDNVVVHVDAPDVPTEVAEDVTVGHAALLHGCRVERGALIGMHATVLNNAVVGEEAIVAAHALVPPGMHVPPRTLVAGVPAKVRRELEPVEIEHIRFGKQLYVELGARFLAEDDEREADAAGEGA